MWLKIAFVPFFGWVNRKFGPFSDMFRNLFRDAGSEILIAEYFGVNGFFCRGFARSFIYDFALVNAFDNQMY